MFQPASLATAQAPAVQWLNRNTAGACAVANDAGWNTRWLCFCSIIVGDWVPSIGHCVYHQGRCSFFFYLFGHGFCEEQFVDQFLPVARTICWRESVSQLYWCDSPFHLTLFTEPSPASSHLASTVSPATTQSVRDVDAGDGSVNKVRWNGLSHRPTDQQIVHWSTNCSCPVIGYSTSSSSISVQSLWETESLQLDTCVYHQGRCSFLELVLYLAGVVYGVDTVLSWLTDGSLFTEQSKMKHGSRTICWSVRTNLLISCTVWQSVSSYFVHRTTSPASSTSCQHKWCWCHQLHNQRVFQPASLATAQAPAVFLFKYCGSDWVLSIGLLCLDTPAVFLFNHCGRLSPFNWTLCLPSRKM